jgi:hypothetical protein
MELTKTKYWRNRMMEKLLSQTKQRAYDLGDYLKTVRFLKEDKEKFEEAIKKINQGYVDLEKAIMSL